MSEGVKNGDVNRPASRTEIQKLPRERCKVCGLEATKPIVVEQRCANGTACARRLSRSTR